MHAEMHPISTKLGYSTPDSVVVRGLDLPEEILGNVSLGDMAWLVLMGRLPSPQESRLFNASVVTLIEHGITPSALAARLTYTGAPESIQAAVAAGLSGLGTVFVGSMEGAAKMLEDALIGHSSRDSVELQSIAEEVITRFRAERKTIPGIGHPVHKPVDPRATRLFEIARECGKDGQYVQLMQLIHKEAERQSGKNLPINATGAIGAICCELGIPCRIVRGIGVMARSIGLVGHILEEMTNPIGMEIWARADREALTNVEGEQ